MKLKLAIVLLMLVSSTIAQAQQPTQRAAVDPRTDAQRAAKAELNAAARAYMSGKWAEAQRHSERALEIDPANKHAPSFIARSIRAQYRSGDSSPENIAKAREAIAAYQRVLLKEPENEDAYNAIATLYGGIGENDLQYSWILQRALNANLPATKRAEAYVILASKDWDCSFTITERPENKQVARTKAGDDIIVYRRPKDQNEFDTAQQCASRGMDMAGMSITLDPENNAAWSFKVNLLLELAKLSEMEENRDRGEEYRRLFNEAQKHSEELSSKKRGTIDVNTENLSAVTTVDSGGMVGGVQEGRATGLPKPEYPPIAKTARAQGEVVVQVTIDERGNVIAASAISGHPLLRAAAVQAAREAKFKPTTLSGQPVKVTGTIKYNFALPVVENESSIP